MDSNKRTALLLEDEPLIAMDLEYTLGDAGFDVSIVATCAEATERLDVGRPEIVVVNIMLRDGPSDALVGQLAEDSIPFIVHSGDQPDMHAGTHQAAHKAAASAAQRQQLAGESEGIQYQDNKGEWHEELASGGDRPQTDVEDTLEE